MKKYFYPAILLCLILTAACGDTSKKENVTSEAEKKEKIVDVPVFAKDSAYFFIEQQVNFGPRVPGTEGHKETGDFLVSKLKSYGAVVSEQKFEATTYDNHRVELRNIVGEFFPEKSKRILLAAHWDTRPFADKDETDPEGVPDGANDGGSGVGILLEIARILSTTQPPDVGVDIIFFDGEDWGEKHNEEYLNTPDTLDTWWCLGSQYWSKNKHRKNYSAYYGILLDMVGATGSQFHKEGLSMKVAPKVVNKIWDRAIALGFSGYFKENVQAEITDDHIFVNKFAKIPMVNIVHYDPVEGYFGDYHHTMKDNMDLIDRETLKVVGTTVLSVIYYE